MTETFLARLNIPKACLLDKPVFKRMFLDNSELDVTDKKALSEDIEKIRWAYTLKPETINITPYKDEEREYLEIALLTVELIRPDRARRIASFMHKAIPYPLIVIFTLAEKVSISVAEKRINQADKSKLVVIDRWQTGWIDLAKLSQTQTAFITSIELQNLPSTNFYALYDAFQARIVELLAADRTGVFNPAPVEEARNQAKTLKQIEALEREIAELRTSLKRQNQMSGKIMLNTRIRKRKDAILALEARLEKS